MTMPIFSSHHNGKCLKVLYLHGLGSTPGGTKPLFLKQCGADVINPQLPDDDFKKSVDIAKKHFTDESPDVVVASSRGGAVALASMPPDTKMILICPAWKKFDVPLPKSLPNTTILHSKQDDIVKYDDSLFMVENCNAELVQCGRSHRMTEFDALMKMIGVLFR